MARGKTQPNIPNIVVMRDLATAFDTGGGRLPRDIWQGDPMGANNDLMPASELSGQIVKQLRSAYDELVEAPIPNHLLELLSKLSTVEKKS